MVLVSSVGYVIILDQDIMGIGSFIVLLFFEGEGGLFKMGISIVYWFFKGFFVGVNFFYVIGIIKQIEIQGSISVEESLYKYVFYVDFGL